MMDLIKTYALQPPFYAEFVLFVVLAVLWLYRLMKEEDKIMKELELEEDSFYES
jgi:hypothetical protein